MREPLAIPLLIPENMEPGLSDWPSSQVLITDFTKLEADTNDAEAPCFGCRPVPFGMLYAVFLKIGSR